MGVKIDNFIHNIFIYNRWLYEAPTLRDKSLRAGFSPEKSVIPDLIGGRRSYPGWWNPERSIASLSILDSVKLGMTSENGWKYGDLDCS